VVEEAVQETLARVWRQGQRVGEMWPFAWKVSRRQVATQARRWLMRKRMEGRWEKDGNGSGDEGRTGGEGRLQGATVAWEEVEATLDGEALGQLLAGMELRQQLVGWLCWVAGADSAAAAAVMGMRREAVRMRLSRLRRRLGQLQRQREA
jgi:DNA-directed RNA polymerase specialized sigma24 family protein